MILFSMGYRGRGYSEGYRLFPDEKSFLGFVQAVLDEAKKHKDVYEAGREVKYFDSIQESAYASYGVFEVTDTGSTSIAKRIKPVVRTMIANAIGHLPMY